jgi:hypothetical protein
LLSPAKPASYSTRAPRPARCGSLARGATVEEVSLPWELELIERAVDGMLETSVAASLTWGRI